MEFAASLTPWISLTGAFLEPTSSPLYKELEAETSLNSTNVNTSVEHWEVSVTNPRNKVECLKPIASPRWRIDGCCSRGTQFFLIPLFLTEMTPLRIDLFIPDQGKHPIYLRRALGSSAAVYTQDRRVNKLGITKFILKMLEQWYLSLDLTKFFQFLPFGSRIVIENITTSFEATRFRILPNFQLERQLLSSEELKRSWGLSTCISWPPSVDLMQLELCGQLHDTISVVRIPHLYGKDLFIFKSSTHDYGHIYHELRLLLEMPAHSNVISKPVHLVMAKTKVQKLEKVYGFILKYHRGGTLANALNLRTANGTIFLTDQLRWARQIVSALIFIRKGPAKYYSELKPNNIVLTSPGDDIILIDFEQHANWETFSPPEVHHVESLERLLSSNFVPESDRKKFEFILSQHAQDSPHLQDNEIYKTAGTHNFCAWESLMPQQQESAMVYALGKLLWCIFEGQDHTQNSLLEEYDDPSSLEFPNFRKTPETFRETIKDCTKGSNDWTRDVGGLLRIGDKFYYRDTKDFKPEGSSLARDAMEGAHRMWKIRVKEMEDYLEAKLRWKDGIADEHDLELLGFPSRPSLNSVLENIKQYKIIP